MKPDDLHPTFGVTQENYNKWLRTLTEQQARMWAVLEKNAGERIDRLQRMIAGGNGRDELFNAFEAIKGQITPELLRQLIDNAVKKGDAQVLRVLAILAGCDLSERPTEQLGEGAKLIIIKPHSEEKEIAGVSTTTALR